MSRSPTRVAILGWVLLSMGLHILVIWFVRINVSNEPVETVSLSITLTEESGIIGQASETMPHIAPPTSPSAGIEDEAVTRQTPIAPSATPSAARLLLDAKKMALAQEAREFQTEMRQKRLQELTRQNLPAKDPFQTFSDDAGWMYVEVGGVCLKYRESKQGDQFDEPVMMYTQCLNKAAAVGLFDNITPSVSNGGRTSIRN